MESRIIHEKMGISYSHEKIDCFLRFRYTRSKGNHWSQDAVWCRSMGDFLSLLFYWSADNEWSYRPFTDENGYIVRPT